MLDAFRSLRLMLLYYECYSRHCLGFVYQTQVTHHENSGLCFGSSDQNLWNETMTSNHTRKIFLSE